MHDWGLDILADLREKIRVYEICGEGDAQMTQMMRRAADEIGRLRVELSDCRNELCRWCGNYLQKHLGGCEQCRWKDG